MTQLKPWCWQVAQDGKGPDWLFIAHVTPESTQALAAATADFNLTGYSLIPNVHDYCPTHQQFCHSFTLIDSSNADTYQRNLTTTEAHNIWIYNLLQIHGNSLTLEAGYGGRGTPYDQLETAWLLQLFRTSGIQLQTWQVMAGGNGYDYVVVQAGTYVDSFINYLIAKN